MAEHLLIQHAKAEGFQQQIAAALAGRRGWLVGKQVSSFR